MANTTFTDGQTPILASWLNDVNDAVYEGTFPSGTTIPANKIVYTPPGFSQTNVEAGKYNIDAQFGSSTLDVLYRNGTVYESQGTVVKQEVRPFYNDYRPTIANGSPFNTDGGNMFLGWGSGNFTMKPDSGAQGDYNLHTSHNQGFGVQALGSLTTGYKNVALGTNGLRNNTEGYGNVAVGRDSSHENTTGFYNTAVGFTANFYNSTGHYNVAVGTGSLYNNTTSQNTGVGYRAGFESTGANNTFFGYYSGRGVTSGTYNTIIGATTTAMGITTGSNNTIVGSRVSGLSNISDSVIIADGNGTPKINLIPAGSTPSYIDITSNDATVVDLTATDGQENLGSSLILKNNRSANNNLTQIAFQSRGSSPWNRIVSWGGTTPRLSFITNNVECTKLDEDGNLIQKVNSTAPTLSTNQTMSFELTSDTTLKIKVRGSDGVTRSVSLTLA